ncbi:MAG: Gfo/Idh/MocA family oxidoreductase [Alphaproteobacteria bacterium]|nr:Gfo/Idh/MocA family oxidoreductase [Alphaproteobacteria bacterium]MDE2041447.1 Gfo/Idh/MocA family oxidoreductase [Alphaproteobacteria bacterium]MDE2339523.1 Gfo/Idh/MocA family oxidoreductase [Alphaproteobacteria bacterium]
MVGNTGQAPIRIGIVGYGKIARDQHVPALAALPELDLVAIADPATRHELLPSYCSLSELLAAQPDLDAVALCMPPGPRAAIARQAIAAGKHVFLEKPPALDIPEAEALACLARNAGVTLFAAWHSRMAAGVAPARAFLATRTVREIRIIWKEDVRVWHPGQKWILQENGFGVFDPGINALSILTGIIAEPVRVKVATLQTPANFTEPIAADLGMVSHSGVQIDAAFDFRQTGPQSWDIVIETGAETLTLQNGGNRLLIDDIEQETGPEQEYIGLYQHFADLIAHGKSDVDVAPLALVHEALSIGTRQVTAPFDF